MALIDMPDGTVFDTVTGERYTDRDAADRWAKGGGGGGGDIQPPPGYDTWEQWQQAQGTFPGKGVFPPGTQPPDWSQPPEGWTSPYPPPYGFASWSAYYAAQQQQGGGGVQPGAGGGGGGVGGGGLPGTATTTDPLAAFYDYLGMAGREARNPWESYRKTLFNAMEAMYNAIEGLPGMGGEMARPGQTFTEFLPGAMGDPYGAASRTLSSIFGSPTEEAGAYFHPVLGAGKGDIGDMLRASLAPRMGWKMATYWADKLAGEGPISMGYRAMQEANPEDKRSFLDWAIGRLPVGLIR